MSRAGEKLRILIPTTSGPVEILLLTEEDPAIGRSVACIGGTTDTADIAAAYHAFVARPTGLIESLFGHPCYRLDVSGRIDAGSSWQLGVLAAHALFATDRLAQESDTAAGILWATGSVRPVDLTVGGVSHLPEKLAASMERLKQEAAAGRRVLVTIPIQNAPALSADLKADLATHGIEVLELAALQSLWDRLAVEVSKGSQRIAANLATPPGIPLPVQARKRRMWGVGAAGLLCATSAAIYLLGRSPAPVAEPEPVPTPPPARREAEALVPETVPFISDRDRALIQAVYFSAPDHKALAVSSSRMGFTTAQRDQETASTAAVAACQRATDEAGARSRCELYAVDNIVVSSRGRPPMPQQPWIIRDPSIERPFALADVPLVTETSRQAIEKDFAKARKTKALALSASGVYSAYTSQTGSEEAVRRALERCGSNSGAACMIIALDDMFVVPIPKSMKVVGFARPGTINAIAPEFRDDVARRLGNATSGWNAVAAGASGRVGVKLGAESEQAAIEGAMADCSRQDRACRVAVIGPFLVEPRPSPVPAATPAVAQASQTSDAMKSNSVIAALASVAPGLAVSAREDLAKNYDAMKEHKALAVVPGTVMHFRTTGWLTGEAAEEGVLERCQAVYMKPCALLAVDGRAQAAPTDGKWPTRDMARVHYAGTFDPDRIPGVSQAVRARPDVVAYRNAAGPKAAASHPWGRIFTVLTAENQRAAEVLVLSNCNADQTRQGQGGPCHLYAIGDQVVLPQRRTGPVTP